MRYSYLLKTNIFNEIPTLFCGPTGTGKSVYIKNVLLNDLPYGPKKGKCILFVDDLNMP